jgi:hypothetical protein
MTILILEDYISIRQESAFIELISKDPADFFKTLANEMTYLAKWMA